MGSFEIYSTITTVAAAATNSNSNDVIRRLQDKADPIGSIMLVLGFFLVMLGQKDKGLKVVKWVAIGYIGIQFVPTIMDWIKEIARGV